MDSWVLSILADPITKQSVDKSFFSSHNGFLDARIFLKHTAGHQEWSSGQLHYEQWEKANFNLSVRHFRAVIEYDRPIYQRFPMAGRILDVGGGRGTVREFLDPEIEYISTDPWLECMDSVPSNLCEAFASLNRPLNFIAAMAEFQPFVSNSFDWVHMRSMLDHVQVPDLAILEARRVLKHDGHLLVGLLVEGGKSGAPDLKERVKLFASRTLEFVGIVKWKDHHTWHPTFENLLLLLEDNGFICKDVFWQPHWKNKVCYILAAKSN